MISRRSSYDLNPPGCGALFLRRGTAPACKKQTAFLLRLANFPCGRRRALVKIGARRQRWLPVSSTGRGRRCCPCSASAVSAAGSASAAQPSTLFVVYPCRCAASPFGGTDQKLLSQPKGRRSNYRFRAPVWGRPAGPEEHLKGGGWGSIINEKKSPPQKQEQGFVERSGNQKLSGHWGAARTPTKMQGAKPSAGRNVGGSSCPVQVETFLPAFFKK